jgi:hypothetical protein
MFTLYELAGVVSCAISSAVTAEYIHYTAVESRADPRGD